MKHLILCMALFLSGCVITVADTYNFNRTQKYRIQSLYTAANSVATGANHGVNSPLCVASDSVLAADCWWYLLEQSSGRYYIINAATEQYVTFDSVYSNSPTIRRYIHMSDNAEGVASLWNIGYYENATLGKVFYIQSAQDNGYYFNLRTSTMVLGAYDNNSTPSSQNGLFSFFDSSNKNVLTGESGPGGDDDDDDPIYVDDDRVVDPDTVFQPIVGAVDYVYLADGRVNAVPQMYVDSISNLRDSIILNLKGDAPRYAYARYEVDSISTICPQLPRFNSFKFNDKYNPHLIDDAACENDGDSLLTLNVVGIGKTLRPSFRLDDDVQAFIGDSLQTSKVDRVRFAKDVFYTVARRGQTLLRRDSSGVYKVMPLGRRVRVKTNFATDHSSGEYNVPTVYITTDNGTSITSKHYYWNGKVRIDGAGVFPDLPETAMQIKGRGNTSWPSGGAGKAPYHMKFNTSTSVLGLKKGKHWNLIANAQRYSMTTNAVAMKMAQLVETAGFNHEIPVELYINGDYRGSYNLTEKIGFHNNSIDLDDETCAAMLELDSYYDETYKFREANYNLPVNIKDPDFSEGTTKITQTQIQQSVNRATTALKNGEDMQYYVDLDYLARFLFVNEFSANFELMHPKSLYVYNTNILDSDSRFVFGPVWDFDWGFGYAGSGGYFNRYSTVDYYERSGGNGQPWVKAQRYCGDNFNRIYYRLWRNFINDGRLQELIDFCGDYYRFAAPSYTHDNTMWNHGDAKAYATVTNNCKNWLRERADYVLNYMGNTLGYEGLGYGRSSSRRPTVGDVNGDGSVTTADLVCILNYILGLPNEDFDFDQADTDHNSLITVADLISVRNLIPTSRRSAGFFSLPEADARILTGEVSYNANGITVPLSVQVEDGQYSGLQFDLKIPAGMMVDNLDISSSIPDFDVNVAALDNSDYLDHSIDRYRVSIYSGANHQLPAGHSDISLELGWGSVAHSADLRFATLSDVMFATTKGEDERASSSAAEFVSGELTGLNSAVAIVSQTGNQLTLRSSDKAVLPVYGVDGRLYRLYQLSEGLDHISLPAGIYIINKQKIVVR